MESGLCVSRARGGDKLWPLVFGDARSGVPSVLVRWLPFVLGLDVLRASLSLSGDP